MAIVKEKSKTFPLWFQDSTKNANYVSEFSRCLKNLPIETQTDTFELFGSLAAGGNKWSNFIVASDGYTIYGVPYDSLTILKIDTRTNTISEFGNFVGSTKWRGACLAQNGAIYFIPSAHENVLKLEPLNADATTLLGSLGVTANKWADGAITSGGVIYGAPRDAVGVLKIDTNTDTVTTIGALGAGDKWATTFLGLNNKIYGIPLDSTQLLEINPVGDVITLSGVYTGVNKWFGSAVGKDGITYGIPYSSSLVFKIDTSSGSPVVTTFGSVVGVGKYVGGFTGGDGNVYGCPVGVSNVFKLTVDTQATSSIASPASIFLGAKLVNNGKVYFAPFSGTQVMTLFDSVEANKNFVLSRFNNK